MKKNFLFYISVVLLIQSISFAQSSSTLTRLGVGDIQYSYSGRNLGLGELGVSILNEDFISTSNPASWARISRTRIEVGFNYNGVALSQGSNSRFTGEAEFSGFTFGFPISQKYGIGASGGIIPFSNVSYQARSTVSLPNSSETFNTDYEGEGGLSKLYLGSSYETPIGVIMGASLDYYFGNIHHISKVDFSNEDNLNSEYRRTLRPKGLGTTFGLISPDLNSFLNIPSIGSIRLGGSVNWFSNLKTDTLITFSSLYNLTTLNEDTIAQGIVEMNIPIRYSLGLSFTLSQNYLFTLDYSAQSFSEYELNKVSSNELRNSFKMSAGMEFRRKREDIRGFWDQVFLRAGVSYEQTPYIIAGEGVDQISGMLGFSLPIAYQNTLDIGLMYGQRSSNPINQMKESIFRLNVGVSLGDLWFIRSDKF